MVAVKVCGVTSIADAELCIEAGVDAIGLNFYERSPRCIGILTATEIVAAIAGRALTVGVFVDASYERIADVKAETGLKCVQLHGDEPPELVARFLPHAYKAVRVKDAASLELARSYPGEHLLLDAFVPGQAGGTGQAFDWELAASFARERKLTLAGGLTPANVAEAVLRVQPFCVDVASGVERDGLPREKDRDKVRAFVAAAKGQKPI